MGSKYKKIIDDFYSLSHPENHPNHQTVDAFLKNKSLKLTGVETLDWKAQLMEAYAKLKEVQKSKEKINLICQELISQSQRILKNKDLELEMIINELTQTRNLLEEEKIEQLRIQKDHESSLIQERKKTTMALERLEQKQVEIRELEQKIQEYEEQIQEIKSTEYQHMINSIKQEEILNSQTQTLFKENTLLKHQLKQANMLNITLNKVISQIKSQAETYQLKYQKTKKYIHNKFIQEKEIDARKQKKHNNPTPTRNKVVETPINLIDFKDDFSFKDSIENDNNSIHVANYPQSFLHYDSSSECFYGSQESSERYPRQRDILNLTDRGMSTHSRISKNVSNHLLRSKKNMQEDKENISQNTWEYNDFDTYHQDGKKVSNFGAKRHQNTQQQAYQNNGQIQCMLPSERRFDTQQRGSLLSKHHRRIKSSFCGKSIHQFQQYENTQNITNSEKLTESMIENNASRNFDEISEQQQESKKFEQEPSGVDYDVNQIVINEELISSYKPKTVKVDDQAIINSVEEKDDVSSMEDSRLPIFDAKMITSVQVKPQQTFSKFKQTSKQNTSTQQPDIYYAFFSLTAQCAKLNQKNFNQAISVYFNLEEEYNNVVKKLIPINKWYNYIEDQIQTSIKYQR